MKVEKLMMNTSEHIWFGKQKDIHESLKDDTVKETGNLKHKDDFTRGSFFIYFFYSHLWMSSLVEVEMK